MSTIHSVPEGIRALMRAANTEPLDFRIRMYCGNLMVSGRVAPASWWYQVTTAARAAEIEQERGSKKGWGLPRAAQDANQRSMEAQTALVPFQSVLTHAQSSENGEVDELTLIDVDIYPADFNEGTQTGGQKLPVARVPLSSIDLWWIVSGETLRKADVGGRGGGSGWAFTFPIPIS